MDDVTPSGKFPSLIFILFTFSGFEFVIHISFLSKRTVTFLLGYFLGGKLCKSKTILIEGVNNNTIFTA